MKNTALTAVLAIGLQAASFVQAESPAVTPRADTVVDAAAMNFPDGRFGTSVNGQTYQQEGVITFNGHQYAAFFADGGILAVGRRKLPGEQWEVIRFPDYKMGNHKDAHNVASLGLCEADGTIHLSFDHHNNALRYRRSVQGLASRPDEFEWKAEHFGPITSKLDGVNVLENVTYPQFFAAPEGRLQMVYRTGHSGHGDWFLADYDPTGSGQWTTLGIVLAKEGTYQTSPSRCGYPNPPRYDANGRLHLTWCWRESPKDQPFDLRTNHDLLYAWSDDRGRTWHNNAGDVIASLTGEQADAARSITIDSPGTVAQPTRWLWGQMNTTTQFVDRNRVHVINWQQPDDAPAGSKDLNTWRYVHYWRDTDGTWHANKLPFHGRKPQIAVDPAGTVYVVHTKGENANYHGTDHGGNLMIAAASEASGWTDWKVLWKADRLSVGEPLLDHARWKSEGVLSIYIQDKPASAGAPSALRVIDFVFPGSN